MTLNFTELMAEIETMPEAWYPGLLKTFVIAAIERNVFPGPDGVLKAAQDFEKEYRWALENKHLAPADGDVPV